MKYYETRFEDYINANKKVNLHPKLQTLYKLFPEDMNDLNHMIFYGPAGVGKYTQVLSSIKKYSSTNLKYLRKINITYQKKHEYSFKTSDIHFEIDMALLGCNAKILWNEIFNHILDVLATKPKACGIIICKNFHTIHNELLDVFYSYMQTNIFNNEKLTYILISEEISFIPRNIIYCSKIISIPRPTKVAYNKCLKKKIDKTVVLSSIKNIKNMKTNIHDLTCSHKIICHYIIQLLENYETLQFMELREVLYNIFIYHFSLNECIWFILHYFVKTNQIKKKDLSSVFLKLFIFFKYYNNNYRPIFHLEKFFLYLCKTIHGL